MNRHRVIVACVLTAVALAATACASSAPKKKDTNSSGDKVFVVGYSQSNNAEPYRAQLNIQLKYFIKQYKNLKLLPITDAHQSSATQVSQVQNFIQQNVDVLIVSPNEPDPLSAPGFRDTRGATSVKSGRATVRAAANRRTMSSWTSKLKFALGRMSV